VKIRIEATQEEFDLKRDDLIKALSKKPRSRYDQQRSVTEPRKPYYKAQEELLEFHNTRFREMLEELKKEIGEVIQNGDSE